MRKMQLSPFVTLVACILIHLEKVIAWGTGKRGLKRINTNYTVLEILTTK
jgi:hypothetical protein